MEHLDKLGINLSLDIKILKCGIKLTASKKLRFSMSGCNAGGVYFTIEANFLKCCWTQKCIDTRQDFTTSRECSNSHTSTIISEKTYSFTKTEDIVPQIRVFIPGIWFVPG